MGNLAGDLTKLNVGPCWVTVGSGDNERCLGYTKGGVSVTPTVETEEIEVDQIAGTADEKISKLTFEVDVPLAQYEAQNLALGIPGAVHYQNAAVAASLQTDFTGGDDSDLLFTAQNAGAAGNDISIALLDPGVDTEACSVSVVGNAISVTLKYGTGAISATAAEVKAAIEADEDAAALISVALSGTGEGTVEALAETSLASGADLKEKVVFGDPAGVSLLDRADVLLLHPKALDALDASEDFKFTKAAPTMSGSLDYDKTNPKVINLKFKIFWDSSISNYGIFGDSSTTEE